MFCARCGVSNAESGKFCVSCGAPLQAQQAPITPAAPIASARPPIVSTPPPPGVGPVETSGKAIASLICGICFLIFPAAVAASFSVIFRYRKLAGPPAGWRDGGWRRRGSCLDISALWA